jgi:predicted peroxiredoxin
MATLLFNGTYGPDNPTRASMPFHFAAGAVDADITVQVLLTADATLLLKDAVAQTVQGVGMPPLTELVTKVVAAGSEIHV